jgi:hypothetical protein
LRLVPGKTFEPANVNSKVLPVGTPGWRCESGPVL